MPRARKDDAKPKGRMSAYAYFLQTMREETKKKKPNEAVVFTEFTKKCAEQWKTMSEKDKQKFHKMAEKDKVRYDSQMNDYVPTDGIPKTGRGSRGGKAKKDPDAPKRSLSAFFWFCDEERPKVRKDNPDWPVGQVAKELGRRWALVSDSDKVKFQKKAEMDKQRYDKDMAAYKKGGSKAPAKKTAKHVEEDDDEDDEEEEEEEDEEEEDDE